MSYRRMYLQRLLNRMVTSVRHGAIKPDDASRTIHECAAMLGLTLAHDLPQNSVIVTGMRKTEKKDMLHAAFRPFGEIAGAAVAPGERGFGLVRFKKPKTVLAVMAQYNRSEIVVSDVAVTVRVLKSSDNQWDPSGRNPSRDPSPAPMSRKSSL
jgi:hypothetical protein